MSATTASTLRIQANPLWTGSWQAQLGEVVALAFDPQDRLHLLHRADFDWANLHNPVKLRRPVLALVDPETGACLDQWGQDLFAQPHGISFDPQGHLWIVDCGQHQVFQFSPDRKLCRSFGVSGEPGQGPQHFQFPTDIAFFDDGSFVISDGYGNSRLQFFDANGQFHRSIGMRGSLAGQFNLPHSLVLDRRGRLLVADRGNARIQVFQRDGSFCELWQDPIIGTPWTLRRGPDGSLFGLDAGDGIEQEPCAAFFALDPDGKPRYRCELRGSELGRLDRPHGLAIDREGAIYIAEIRTRRVQKFSLHEQQQLE